jgi:hypothetical protein
MNSALVQSYELDNEPTYPTEEQAHEAYLQAGWDYLAEEEVVFYEDY